MHEYIQKADWEWNRTKCINPLDFYIIWQEQGNWSQTYCMDAWYTRHVLKVLSSIATLKTTSCYMLTNDIQVTCQFGTLQCACCHSICRRYLFWFKLKLFPYNNMNIFQLTLEYSGPSIRSSIIGWEIS